MKPLLFSVLLIILATPFTALAQTINLQVKGVQIGTSYSSVLQKLGEPLSNKKGGFFPCDGGTILTMRYSGLVLKLMETNNGKKFFVASVEITSSKWSASDIKIGASIKNVREKFGSSNLTKEEGFDNLSYFITDGYANFYFRNKKLVKISWELNVC